MDASVLVPLGLLVVVGVPTVRALSRSLTAPVTRSAVQSFAVAMGRLALALALAAFALSALIPASAPSSTVWTMPVVAGGCTVLLTVLERRWPRQRGTVRVAHARRRTLWSVVRRSRALFAAVGWLGLATAVAAEIGIRSPVPNAGEDTIGVAVTPTAVDPTAVSTLTLTVTQPVPSMIWTWVAVGGLAVVTGVAALAVRQVLRRPVLADVDDDTDTALRRMSAERLLRLVGAAAFGTAGILCSDMSTALYLLGVNAKGVVVGVAWLANCGAWVGGLGVLIAYLAGPIKLPRTSRAPSAGPVVQGR